MKYLIIFVLFLQGVSFGQSDTFHIIDSTKTTLGLTIGQKKKIIPKGFNKYVDGWYRNDLECGLIFYGLKVDRIYLRYKRRKLYNIKIYLTDFDKNNYESLMTSMLKVFGESNYSNDFYMDKSCEYEHLTWIGHNIGITLMAVNDYSELSDSECTPVIVMSKVLGFEKKIIGID